jgi:hypothetical protein
MEEEEEKTVSFWKIRSLVKTVPTTAGTAMRKKKSVTKQGVGVGMRGEGVEDGINFTKFRCPTHLQSYTF